MSKRTDFEAGKFANSLSANVGLDPVTILTIASTLLSVLAKLFQTCQSAAPTSEQSTAKEYLLDRYDMQTGTFDTHFVEEMRPRTRRAARKNGERHISVDQVDAISVASLKHALEADDATVAAVFAEAADDEDDNAVDQTVNGKQLEDGSNPAIVL